MPVVGIAGHPALKSLKRPPSILKEGRGIISDLGLGTAVDALRIGVLNLMPNKEQTELQYMELFSTTSTLVDLIWIRQTSRESRHTSSEHLNAYYQTYAEACEQGLDALIVTGSPVEQMEFNEVAYWKELIHILEHSHSLNRPTLFICWAAQAALYHFYGIPKTKLDHKCFGIFDHKVLAQDSLLSNIGPLFYAPHSRHTANLRHHIQGVGSLKILIDSDEAGVFMVRDLEKPFIYLTGHMEYDTGALDREYQRDIKKGLSIAPPLGYYVDNDPKSEIINRWQNQAQVLADNWLNEVFLLHQLAEAQGLKRQIDVACSLKGFEQKDGII